MTDETVRDAAEAAEADAAREAAIELEDGPSPADYSIAFSPRNLAVGLAIVAGLVAFAASRRRRRARGEDD